MRLSEGALVWWCEAEQIARRVKPHKPWGVHDCATEYGCSGQQLVPVDALVIEKVDGEWPQWAIDALSDATSNEVWRYVDFLDALASQVGESE